MTASAEFHLAIIRGSSDSGCHILFGDFVARVGRDVSDFLVLAGDLYGPVAPIAAFSRFRDIFTE